MLGQLIRAGIVFKVFIWLKPRLKALLVTIGIIAVSWLIHSEYLSYAQHSGNTGLLGISFILKWVVTISSVLGYLFYQLKRANIEGISKNSFEECSKAQSESPENDGFDFLRSKDKLESRADKIIRQENRDDRHNS